VEQRTKLALADSQREAVRIALASKVLVITVGPGVGKTTLVNSILKILLAKTVEIALCAPTGPAAKRLSESTGSRRRRSIACSKPIPEPAASDATRRSRSIAICWSSTRPRWSMSRSCALCSARSGVASFGLRVTAALPVVETLSHIATQFEWRNEIGVVVEGALKPAAVADRPLGRTATSCIRSRQRYQTCSWSSR
jgi:hypothetical protein